MKLTLSKIIWIANKINHYCNLLRVEEPYIFTTMAEYDKWKENIRNKPNQRVGYIDCYGVCHRKEKFIVILIKRHSTLLKLDETIRHELLHYAKHSYSHTSKRFYDCMRKLKLRKINKNGRFI